MVDGQTIESDTVIFTTQGTFVPPTPDHQHYWAIIDETDTATPDLGGVEVDRYTDRLNFTAMYGDTGGVYDVWGRTYLDTDQSHDNNYQINGLGAEYMVEFRSTPAPGVVSPIATLFHYPFGQDSGTPLTVIAYDDTAYSFTLPFSAIGSDDGNMDLVQRLGIEGDALTDTAPNSTYGTTSIVSTQDPTNVDAGAATLNGTFVYPYNQGQGIELYFEYWPMEDQNPQPVRVDATPSTATIAGTTFTGNVTGLDAGMYFYRAVATYEDLPSYGDLMHIAMDSGPVTSSPYIIIMDTVDDTGVPTHAAAYRTYYC